MRSIVLLWGGALGWVLFSCSGCGGDTESTEAGGNGGTPSTRPFLGGNQGNQDTRVAVVGGASAGGSSSLSTGGRGGTVTPDACCDGTTGIVTENPCTADGTRRPCPNGRSETYLSQPWCVPLTLQGATCISLEGQPCTGPAMGCHDMSMAIVRCACTRLDYSSAASSTWQCSSFIGP